MDQKNALKKLRVPKIRGRNTIVRASRKSHLEIMKQNMQYSEFAKKQMSNSRNNIENHIEDDFDDDIDDDDDTYEESSDTDDNDENYYDDNDEDDDSVGGGDATSSIVRKKTHSAAAAVIDITKLTKDTCIEFCEKMHERTSDFTKKIIAYVEKRMHENLDNHTFDSLNPIENMAAADSHDGLFAHTQYLKHPQYADIILKGSSKKNKYTLHDIENTLIIFFGKTLPKQTCTYFVNTGKLRAAFNEHPGEYQINVPTIVVLCLCHARQCQQ